MQTIIHFKFKDQQYSADYTICDRESPTYIFITLYGEGIVNEFGAEIVLHANGNTLLTDQIYTTHRLELYTVLFEAIKNTGELRATHEQNSTLQQQQ